MSIVLWNTGLIGGLRRYKEFGIRLALGESKGHIYRTIVSEAVIIGVIGSIVGTAIGLLGTYAMQVYGIDISDMMPNSTMMMPNVIRSKITVDLFLYWIYSGVFFQWSLGTPLSGIGIYKRQNGRIV